MKPNNQTILIIIAIAIIGPLISYLLEIPTYISFILGVIAAGLALHFTPQANIGNHSEIETVQSSKTLYVGNLPYRANETDVKNLFAEHGDVFAVRLMKDKRTGKRRGFGFVVMSSLDADTAIENLNNKEYGQRTLKVREANEPKGTETVEAE